jgi:hypothetical protein
MPGCPRYLSAGVPPAVRMSLGTARVAAVHHQVDVKNCCLVEDHTGFVTRLDELHLPRKHMPLDTPQAAVLAASLVPLGSLHRESFRPAPRARRSFTTRVHLWWQATATTPLGRCKALRDLATWLASAGPYIAGDNRHSAISPPRIASILLQ